MFEEQDVQEFVRRIRQDLNSGRTVDESVTNLRKFIASDMNEALGEAERRLRKEQKRIGSMRRPRTLRGEQGEAWYTGPGEDDRLWWSYRERLEKVHTLPDKAINDIDAATTRILSLMSPPGFSKFNTRGLVMGYVQSGKTANYVGLMAKAADQGYRFFIVLTGMIEALRRQTQERLERDLVDLDDTIWVQLTYWDQDFRKQGNVNAFLGEHFGALPLAVVKKNAYVLDNLLKWIRGANPDILRNLPVLIIDDEADQASVNTKKDEERSRINDQLLELLRAFPKAAYVGYTATPFANVLIDPHIPGDLYPRDFIVDLPRPDGYFGPERIFGREPLSEDEAEAGLDGLDMVRTIPDDEAEQLRRRERNPEAFAETIPQELRRATLYFWLATAARGARGYDRSHSTMLVHTSELAADHEGTRPLISSFREEVKRALDSGDSHIRDEMRQIWESEIARVPPQSENESPVMFQILEPYLAETMYETKVICENHRSDERLDYSNPRQVAIVVGGNVLSRGLTLEGLVVSYFSRSAGAYDTLLQMGRWFGFRHGYSDLPRIWMTESVQQHFQDLATVEEELRRDTQRYELEELTPMEFAPRIRRHPALNITSPVKMQHAEEVERSYEGRRLQTILFHHKDPDWLQGNLQAAKELIREGRNNVAPIGTRYGWIIPEVEYGRILDFIDNYQFHENSRDLDTNLLHRYIRSCAEEQRRLRTWNLVVMSRAKPDPNLGTLDLGVGTQVPLINRARMGSGADENTANIKALMSRPDAIADFPERYEAYNEESPDELVKWRSNERPDTGCILLYPIARNSEPRTNRESSGNKRAPLDAAEHVIGVALVFPSTLRGSDMPQRYMAAPLRAEDTVDYLDSEDLDSAEAEV